MAIVRARIVDANGVQIPRANDPITFTVSGPGMIAATDNGDNSSHESFQAMQRHAFQGKCVAFVKATAVSGTITVTASADGLKGGTASLAAANTEISK